MNAIALCAVSASLALFVVQGRSGSSREPTDLFSVKDSQGRLRLAAEERGDAFALVLYDKEGRPRIVLQTDADGRPSIEAHDKDGSPCGAMAQDKDDSWVIGVRSKDGLAVRLVSAAIGEGGLLINNSDRKTVARLSASTKTGESHFALANPRHPQTSALRAWNTDSGTTGLSIGSDDTHRVGLATFGDRGLLWVGDSPLDGQESGNGVRIGFSENLGASVALRHNKTTPSLLLQDYADAGSGLMIGNQHSAKVKAGISGGGDPSLRIIDKEGKVHFEARKQ